MQQDLERRKQAKTEQLLQEKKRKIELIETDLKRRGMRCSSSTSCGGAVAADPPLLVAIIVFFSRRAREREGVARSRLR